MADKSTAKKVLSLWSVLFSGTDIFLMIFFTILGGLIYGTAIGAAFMLAYTFFALLGVLLGVIPFYGAFLYNGQFHDWLNSTLPQVFGVHLSGLTWFIYMVGLIFTIITSIVVSAVAIVLIGIVVVAIFSK